MEPQMPAIAGNDHSSGIFGASASSTLMRIDLKSVGALSDWIERVPEVSGVPSLSSGFVHHTRVRFHRSG